MSRHDSPPAWLADFQARFSSVLRTGLDRSTGTLRDQRARYDAAACADVRTGGSRDPRAQLATYNRQYWLRLFSVLQDDFPLTTRLLGAFVFNAHAARFFAKHPPRERDLAAAATGFVAFLREDLEQHDPTREKRKRAPARAILQASELDEAFRVVARAPEEPVFKPGPSDLVDLERLRLLPSKAVRLTQEDWPLVKLRDELRSGKHPGERALPLTAAHTRTHDWAVCRTVTGFSVVPLAPLQAELYRALERQRVGEALTQISRAKAGPEGRRNVPQEDLPALTQRYLAEGLRLGLWMGLST